MSIAPSTYMLRAFPLWAALVAAGCLVAPNSVGQGRAAQTTRPSAETGGRLAPLASSTPFITLPVPRHRDAVVSVPLGATSKRPVLVVVHGAGDRPEWQCQVWRRVVGDRGFILCPRGFPTNPYVPPDQTGYFYTTHHALGREIGLALGALKERFPEHADLQAPAFAGFSQGAIMGALLLPNHPARFSRALLVEGGYGFFREWDIPVAQRFSARGGSRVVLACGGDRCVEQAKKSANHMRRGGILTRIIHAVGAGHSYGGAMERELEGAFAWAIEGDPRWTAP
jgi:poly(3-hydroxybutyrate) depolymerase